MAICITDGTLYWSQRNPQEPNTDVETIVRQDERSEEREVVLIEMCNQDPKAFRNSLKDVHHSARLDNLRYEMSLNAKF